MLPPDAPPYMKWDEEVARQLTDFNKRLQHLESLEGGAWNLIGDVYLTIATDPIDFQNIPQIYKHLVILLSSRGTTAVAGADLLIRMNADAGANYDRLMCWHRGDGLISTFSAVGITEAYAGYTPGGAAPANIFGACKIFLPNYANTTTYKQLISEFGFNGGNLVTDFYVGKCSGSWRNPNAISRLQLYVGGALRFFDVSSRACLYGVR